MLCLLTSRSTQINSAPRNKICHVYKRMHVLFSAPYLNKNLLLRMKFPDLTLVKNLPNIWKVNNLLSHFDSSYHYPNLQ